MTSPRVRPVVSQPRRNFPCGHWRKCRVLESRITPFSRVRTVYGVEICEHMNGSLLYVLGMGLSEQKQIRISRFFVLRFASSFPPATLPTPAATAVPATTTTTTTTTVASLYNRGGRAPCRYGRLQSHRRIAAILADRGGARALSLAVNGYLSKILSIALQHGGGDIVKFCGDVVLFNCRGGGGCGAGGGGSEQHSL
jgi:hypothetical protein